MSEKPVIPQRRDWGGLVLVVIGVLLLAAQWTNWSLQPLVSSFLVLVIGIVLLLWGILARNPGALIAGCIVSGIGAGVVLTVNPYAWRFAQDHADGSLFMLAFGLGWILIPILTGLLTPKPHWWALIPGGIILLVGLALLLGGAFMTSLDLLGKLWPLAIIIGGLLILLRRNTQPSQ